MDRFSLTDAQWERMQPFCLGKPSDPGRTGGDGRLFLEAVLWIARTGSPWRDLPPLFGKWNSVFKRFRDWVKADVFKRMFEAVSDDPDMEYAMVDATIVKVHRHGLGAKGGLIPVGLSGDWFCPRACGERSDALGQSHELVPSVLASVEDGFVGFPHPMTEPVAAQELPHIFHRIKLRRIGRQRQQHDVIRHLESR